MQHKITHHKVNYFRNKSSEVIVNTGNSKEKKKDIHVFYRLGWPKKAAYQTAWFGETRKDRKDILSSFELATGQSITFGAHGRREGGGGGVAGKSNIK